MVFGIIGELRWGGWLVILLWGLTWILLPWSEEANKIQTEDSINYVNKVNWLTGYQAFSHASIAIKLLDIWEYYDNIASIVTVLATYFINVVLDKF